MTSTVLGVARAARPVLMGIVNVTPDSFSDGGMFFNEDAAIAHARKLADEGAEILDIGGESSRPGHVPVSEDIELSRAIPVVAAAATLGVPVSIDTVKSGVARAAIGAGARIINDIWGLQRDPAMARVAADGGAHLVLMHNRDTIDGGIDILADVLRFLEKSIAIARAHGIDQSRLVVDPGLGFGKTFEQNVQLITSSNALHALGCPVLIGLSRKSFIGAITGRKVTERLAGSLAANLAAARHGADVLRVHDVAAMKDALAADAAVLEHHRA